jgi:predicted RNase H-like nuclease (RuvC/YqgF family)
MELQTTLAHINLSLLANKILFRQKYEPKKKEELDRQVKDLDQVKSVLLELETQNKALQRKMWELHEENLKLKQLNEELKLIIDL